MTSLSFCVSVLDAMKKIWIFELNVLAKSEPVSDDTIEQHSALHKYCCTYSSLLFLASTSKHHNSCRSALGLFFLTDKRAYLKSITGLSQTGEGICIGLDLSDRHTSYSGTALDHP
jgi:hypothetical protein